MKEREMPPKIEDRNTDNRLASIEARLEGLQTEIQLQRAQYIGLGAALLLIAYGLYKVGAKLPA
jgi:hypothetical protein